MVDTKGLSLDQAPPIDLPLRFFLTAPWFVVAAGLILAVQGEAAMASRWTPAALAATHLLAIGFLGQVLCGALLQLLPVIAGTPMPGVGLIATASNLCLSAGSAFLAVGFLGGAPLWLGAGALVSGVGFLTLLSGLLPALRRARGGPATLVAFRLGSVSLALTVLLGLTLAAGLLGWLTLPRFTDWVTAHLSWGLLGCVGLVIVGVAYQVVPLFHVTPSYPGWMAAGLAPSLFLALAAATLALWAGQGALADLALTVAALGFVSFAAVTLILQSRRSRPRLDATLVHWWLAMVAMAVAGVAWWLDAPSGLLGVLILIGVGVGLPSGMLLKIVPFLCWFHLQSRWAASDRRDLRVPHMHQLLPERLARWHPPAHALALVLLCAGTLEPALVQPGALVLCASALWLVGLMAGAAWRYRRVSQALG